MKNLKRLMTPKRKKDYLLEAWKKRIAREKGISESMAGQIARKVKTLAEYMQYGHAIIAYYKQDGTFQLVTGTLVPYSREFHHPFDIEKVHSVFAFWSVEANGWRTFQIENFLDWKAIV